MSDLPDRQIVDLIGFIDGYAWRDQFSHLDYLFDNIKVEQEETIVLLCCLRTTFSYRNKLKSWKNLRDRAKERWDAEDRSGLYKGLT